MRINVKKVRDAIDAAAATLDKFPIPNKYLDRLRDGLYVGRLALREVVELRAFLPAARHHEETMDNTLNHDPFFIEKKQKHSTADLIAHAASAPFPAHIVQAAEIVSWSFQSPGTQLLCRKQLDDEVVFAPEHAHAKTTMLMGKVAQESLWLPVRPFRPGDPVRALNAPIMQITTQEERADLSGAFGQFVALDLTIRALHVDDQGAFIIPPAAKLTSPHAAISPSNPDNEPNGGHGPFGN